MQKLEIPSHLQIETVRGCNARCIMCPLNYAESKLKIKNGRMSEEVFEKIIDKFIPYASKIQFVSLIGIGEPLLDKGLCEKLKYLKEHNFKNIATSTNAALLDEKKQMDLLESGIDTIICSVDGIDKRTHESIRLNTNFERVVGNIQSCIQKRNRGNYKTRFLIRMIRQKLNHQQWPEYVEYWNKFIDRTKRDDVIAFDVHNWSGTLVEQKNIDYAVPCAFILGKLSITFYGEVVLCFDGIISKDIEVGNALTEDPINIFNSKICQYHRAMHRVGLRKYLRLCNGCNIPNQRLRRVLSTDKS